MNGSFFPFQKTLVDNDDFKKMSAVWRLYYLLLVSRFNLYGSFYMSDLEAAVRVNTSVDTIRRARRRFQLLGWVNCFPGFLGKNKRPVSTTYNKVAFATVENGVFFAKISRYEYESLLNWLREGDTNHKSLLMFFYANYFKTIYTLNSEKKDYFISKHELISLTGISGAPEAFLKFNKLEIFGGDKKTFFDIEDAYHAIKIKEHRVCAEPERCEGNRMLAEKYENDAKERIAKAKAAFKNKKPKRKKLKKNP